MLTKKEIFKSKGYNVPSYVFDADGKAIEIETSENEEQSIVYDKIVAALVSTGYFRARIKGINPFDVLVGGMTWCLDSSSVDLDIDFLFREDLNIGQKIALTEKIVAALPKIKCPHSIEPHQIQGLDFIHVYPVIEWLIKWSYENRQKKTKYLEACALNQYYKRFRDKNGEAARRVEQLRCQTVNFILEQYQPRRVCKQSEQSITDLGLRVESTLAEYGLSNVLETQGISLGPQTYSNLLKTDLDILVGGRKNEFSQEKLNFENASKLLSADFHTINSERQVRQLKSELENLKREKERLNAAIEEASKGSEDLMRKNSEKSIKIEELSEEERKIVKKMQSMIQIHEQLKEEEKNFKEICKSELNDLEQEILMLESSISGDETEELKTQAERLQVKLENKKLELGRILRNVSIKERLFDQIPNRAELSQYQKRFLELHNQIALKHTELKRYYILFNTLNDKFHYMEKEYNILNSIHDSYLQIANVQSAAPAGQEEFLRQLRGIVAGIEQAKGKTTEKRNENRRMRDSLADHLTYLEKLKSDYISAVKRLADTYKQNEQLEQRLQRLSLKRAAAGAVE